MTENVYDEATIVLRRTSNEDLLKAFAALTHRMHVEAAAERGNGLRAQRDRVQAEILRRMAR
jgi:hypothetical protein